MACNCKTPKCIMRTKQTFASFKMLEDIKFDQGIKTDITTLTQVSRTGFFTHINSTDKANIYSLSLCGLVKQYYKNYYDTKKMRLANTTMFKTIGKFDLEHDKFIEKYLKLKDFTITLIYKSQDSKKTIKKILNELVNETLRNDKIQAQYKRLKHIFKQESGNKTDLELESESESESESYEDDEDNEYLIYKKYTNPNTTIDNTNLEDLEILKLYESLKCYMCSSNISLSKLAKKNNVDVNLLFEKFGKIKKMRTQIAHPLPSDIKNDNDFMKLLLDF
jgi:hypothetical protein